MPGIAPLPFAIGGFYSSLALDAISVSLYVVFVVLSYGYFLFFVSRIPLTSLRRLVLISLVGPQCGVQVVAFDGLIP